MREPERDLSEPLSSLLWRARAHTRTHTDTDRETSREENTRARNPRHRAVHRL